MITYKEELSKIRGWTFTSEFSGGGGSGSSLSVTISAPGFFGGGGSGKSGLDGHSPL